MLSYPDKLEAIIIISYSTFILIVMLAFAGRAIIAKVLSTMAPKSRMVECLLNRQEFHRKRHRAMYFYFYDETIHQWVVIDNTRLKAKEFQFTQAGDCLDKIKSITGVS